MEVEGAEREYEHNFNKPSWTRWACAAEGAQDGRRVPTVSSAWHRSHIIYLLWRNILLFLEPNFCKVHLYLSSLLKKKKSLDPEPQVWFFSNKSFFSLLRLLSELSAKKQPTDLWVLKSMERVKARIKMRKEKINLRRQEHTADMMFHKTSFNCMCMSAWYKIHLWFFSTFSVYLWFCNGQVSFKNSIKHRLAFN